MPPNSVQEAQARPLSMDDYTPSSNQHDSSSISVSTTQAPTASTASTWNLSAGTSNAPSATSLSGTTACKKRQRGRGVVTRHACTECRIKRAKCDGQEPCRRCSTYDIECQYHIPKRQSKMNLRNTIELLRCQQASNELVINTLSHSRKWKEVLCQLRSGRSVEAIANWLVNQPSLGAGAIPSLSHLSGADTNPISGVGDALYTSEMPEESVSASTMSSMSSDCLLDSRYNMDTNSQWSQSLEASQAHSDRSNSQPATDSSQPFTPKVNADDLVAFWANSVPLPVTPSPASSQPPSLQPAADGSQPLTTNANANDLVTFWANSVPLPVPLPASSVVAGSAAESMESSLFWPFPAQGQPMLPTRDAFVGAGFETI